MANYFPCGGVFPALRKQVHRTSVDHRQLSRVYPPVCFPESRLKPSYYNCPLRLFFVQESRIPTPLDDDPAMFRFVRPRLGHLRYFIVAS